jgi:hypothetical protein
MKRTVCLVSWLFFSAVACQAQTKGVPEPRPVAETESSETEQSGLITQENHLSPPKVLPDAPRPKVSGLANRQDWVMPFHLQEHDRSWGRAMRNPVVLTSSALFVGLAAVQLVKTDRCIDAHKPACNLVTGKSRAATYALNIPLTAGIIWSAAKLKEKGNGEGLVLLLTGGLVYEATTAYTANPHVLVCQAGRTPQCQ